MMSTARRIVESEHFLRRGEWVKWSYDLFAGADIHGATLGVLGMGRIGQAIARRGALGFGMKELYHNRSRLGADIEAQLGASWVTKEQLLRQADHLMLVVPYSAASHQAIGAAELALMKPTATLTNIARGGGVDDVALAQALRDKRIAGGGPERVRRRARRSPGTAESPQRRAHAAHRQRQHPDPARDGTPGGGQPDCRARGGPTSRPPADTAESGDSGAPLSGQAWGGDSTHRARWPALARFVNRTSSPLRAGPGGSVRRASRRRREDAHRPPAPLDFGTSPTTRQVSPTSTGG